MPSNCSPPLEQFLTPWISQCWQMHYSIHKHKKMQAYVDCLLGNSANREFLVTVK